MSIYPFLCRLISVGLFATLPLLGEADPLSYPTTEKKLTSHHPNYFCYINPINKNPLRDEPHLEFLLSLQYPIFQFSAQHKILFHYEGLYDFYITGESGYKSSPLFSRRQNPGLVYTYNHPISGRFIFGYYHESNGQTLDMKDGKTAFDNIAEASGHEYALTQVSRGWDYLSLSYQTYDLSLLDRFDVEQRWVIECRSYLPKQLFLSDREEALFWDRTGQNATISGYDGLHLTYELFSFKNAPTDFSARIELKSGIRSFDAIKKVSGRLSILKRVGSIPFTLFYFNGYGKEPSTYHLRSRYYGIGLEFR